MKHLLIIAAVFIFCSCNIKLTEGWYKIREVKGNAVYFYGLKQDYRFPDGHGKKKGDSVYMKPPSHRPEIF